MNCRRQSKARFGLELVTVSITTPLAGKIELPATIVLAF
jgi:hypothetical protein